MSKTTCLPCLLDKLSGSILQGLTRQYVDDPVSCDNKSFNEWTELTKTKFNTYKKEYNNSAFSGSKIQQNKDNMLLNQNHYAGKIRILEDDATSNPFCSLRNQLSWLCHTRSDFTCAVNMLARVTETDFEKSNMKEFNRILKLVPDTIGQGPTFIKLDKNISTSYRARWLFIFQQQG